MRRYDLYIVEDEVAKAYFGKETKLIQLFSEAIHAEDPEQLIQIEKQIDFITKQLPIFRLETLMKRALPETEAYTVTIQDQEWLLKSTKEDSVARLIIKESHCELWSSGSLLAEAVLFEKLRAVEPYFLAVDRTNERCGWLRPIKTDVLLEG